MPSVSVLSGICWFSVTVKPPMLRSTSFTGGVPENIKVCPAIVRLRSVSAVEPIAGEVPLTEEVELIVVAVTAKIPDAGAKAKLSAVAVAVPVSVGGKGELAVSVTAADRPAAGKLREPEFVTSYAGGADPEAKNAGPTTIGSPGKVTDALKPLDELEMLMTRALAGETPSAGTMPADRANALMVVKADVFSVITQSPFGS
jgi:hypothetical protein